MSIFEGMVLKTFQYVLINAILIRLPTLKNNIKSRVYALMLLMSLGS